MLWVIDLDSSSDLPSLLPRPFTLTEVKNKSSPAVSTTYLQILRSPVRPHSILQLKGTLLSMRIRAPRTPNPASTEDTRFNSLTHGAASRQTFLRGENPEDFFNLLYDTHRYYKPSCVLHAELVTNLAEAHWRLKRCQQAFITFEEFLYEFKPNSVKWSDSDHHQLHLLPATRLTPNAPSSAPSRMSAPSPKTPNVPANGNNCTNKQKQKFELQRQKFEAAQAREKQIAVTRAARQNYAANKAVTEIRCAKNAVSSPSNSSQSPAPMESIAVIQPKTALTESKTLIERGEAVVLAT